MVANHTLEKQDFERIKELTKERLIARRRQRMNQMLGHVAICSAVVLILLSIGVIALVNRYQTHYAAVLDKYIENPPAFTENILAIDEYSRP